MYMDSVKNEFINYRPKGKEMAGVFGDIQLFLKGISKTTSEHVLITHTNQGADIEPFEVGEKALYLATRLSLLLDNFEELVRLGNNFVHPSLGVSSGSFEKGEYAYSISNHRPYKQDQFIHIRRKFIGADHVRRIVPIFPDGFEEKVTISSHQGSIESNKSYIRYFGLRDPEEVSGESIHLLQGLARSENTLFAFNKASDMIADLESADQMFCNVFIEGVGLRG